MSQGVQSLKSVTSSRVNVGMAQWQSSQRQLGDPSLCPGDANATVGASLVDGRSAGAFSGNDRLRRAPECSVGTGLSAKDMMKFESLKRPFVPLCGGSMDSGQTCDLLGKARDKMPSNLYSSQPSLQASPFPHPVQAVGSSYMPIVGVPRSAPLTGYGQTMNVSASRVY